MYVATDDDLAESEGSEDSGRSDADYAEACEQDWEFMPPHICLNRRDRVRGLQEESSTGAGGGATAPGGRVGFLSPSAIS